jgi:ABC-type multidrug transport system fused ATPase/permease subunit
MAVFTIEIREPGEPPRRLDVDRAIHLGRECDGELINDPMVSRSHLRLRASDGGLVASDTGSSNGTTVNGVVITAETPVSPGDIIRIGDTEIVMVARQAATGRMPVVGARGDSRSPQPAPADPSPATAPAPSATGVSADQTPPALRPQLEELAAKESDIAVVRFRPGSAGERTAADVMSAARRGRRRLAGLGSEPWGFRPQICLVDPFPDPAQPGVIMTSGTIVDAARGEIWMVVTPESPPEPLERPLAVLFGSALPAAGDLGFLLEGYGLHVAETPIPDDQLRELDLPALAAAEGELAAAMNLSFVHYLLERGPHDEFRRFLASAQPGRLDVAAQDVYGASTPALEEAWRQKLAAGGSAMKTGQFLRLAVRYMRPHARREAEMAVYMLLGLAFTIVFPFVFRRLLDHAIPSGHFSQVLRLLTFLAIAFVISLLADLRRAYQSAWVSGSVVRQIRTEMFDRLQVLDAGWFSRHQEGDVLSRLFNDVSILEQGLSQTLREGLFQMLSVVVTAVVLLTLNPLLGVIVLVGAPVIGLVYRQMAEGARKRSLSVQEQIGALVQVTSENYSAQSVVKAFALEAKERSRFGRGSERLFKAEVRMQLFGGLFGLSVNMIVTALRLLILGLGAWLILHGHLTIGGLVAFMGLMGEVLSPVTVLTGIGQQIQMSTGALLRINEVLDATPQVTDPPGAVTLPPIVRDIRLDGVSFSYTPERRTLEDLNVTIQAGQRVAFVGPTGAGKSSVLQLLMRFYQPDEGAVRFDGIDLRTTTVASVRNQLGVVFQETFLFDSTIRENIGMGKPGASDAEIEAAARAAELHDYIAGLPRGYDTLVGERGGRLSGGQRQRVAIARALLRDPRILLLDEATSALDPRTERLIAGTLDRVGEGRTTISVTHRLTSITGYDRIFVVVAGKLVEEGTHAELLAMGGTYAGLWAEQTGGAMPAEAPFDALEVLARVPLFAQLGQADLASVARRLRAAELAAGETVLEGGGRLMLISRGRGTILIPGLTGDLVPSQEVGPGDAFGLAALMGNEIGAVLRAGERLGLLVLDDESIAGLAASQPTVAAALEGRKASAAGPAGGRRLSRVSLAPGSRLSASFVEATGGAALPSQDIRRASGSYSAVGK